MQLNADRAFELFNVPELNAGRPAMDRDLSRHTLWRCFLRARSCARVLAFALSLAQMACTQPGSADDFPPPAQAAQLPPAQLPSFADVVQKVLPAVVNITAVRTRSFDEEEEPGGDENAPDFGNVQSPLEEFLRRFFGQQSPFGLPNEELSPTRVTALGSGFLSDPAGYVVTDYHVVAKADSITVLLQDNSRYPAKVVGQDEISDLALLKIEAGKPLPFVTWGDSDASRVGDWILAVGNPFGLGGTVTAGIISARGRDIRAGLAEDFLQIDAPLNRGNSGGPTFNLAGQVIGINTAIYTPSGGSVGIGFAIPSNLAKPVIDQLRAHGRVERGWLGVQLQEVTPEIARSFGLANAEGALVVDVTPDSPADKAGIRQGDVVLAFNGRDVSKPRDLSIGVAGAAIGKAASIRLWRAGKTVVVSPVIGERAQTPPQAPERPRLPRATSSMGLRLGALTDDLRRELRLPPNSKGAVVLEMGKGPLADSGLERGDVIEEINHHAVTTPQAAAARLKEAFAAKDQNVLLLINRQGSKRYLAIAPRMGGDTSSYGEPDEGSRHYVI
jgi:serine protease Do